MAGTRPFDDGRWPDQEGLSECFLCGKMVYPTDPLRGTYDEPPSGPKLDIHLPCLDAIPSNTGLMRKEILSIRYHVALTEMVDRQYRVTFQ